jgi:glycosyltransferase involved in cell wall biosynthesis
VGLAAHLKSGFLSYDSLFIPNGVNTSEFRPDHGAGALFRQSYRIPLNALVIGSVTRPAKEKGLEYLLRAFSQFWHQHPCFLLLVGEGLPGFLEDSKIIDNSLREFVVCTGVVENVPAALNAMDIFCLPSLCEAFSLSLCEAVSCGVVSVASDAGDTKSILPIPHWLVKPASVASLISVLSALTESIALRQEEYCDELRAFAVQNLDFSLVKAQYYNIWSSRCS